MTAWIYLLLAGVCEIGWPLGFKLAQTTDRRLLFILFAAVSMGASGWLLYSAQKIIPIGTAYAVWTGIGAAGTFAVGILLFGDAVSWGGLIGVGMIVGGVVVLKVLGAF